MKQLKIEVSPGELLDKITIFEIKIEKIKDKSKRNSILSDFNRLIKIYNNIKKDVEKKSLNKLHNDLYKINLKLWNIENRIRRFEAKQDFGNEFIKLARSVYMINDERSSLKNKINKFFNSGIHDVKEYSEYEKIKE